MSTTWTPKVFVKPIGVVQHTYVVRGHGLDKKKRPYRSRTRNKGVVERPDMPLGSMTWLLRSPRVDDRTYRSTDSCGKGHRLDPLLDKACNGGHSVGSDPTRSFLEWGKDIETKCFSGRSPTPIRTKRKKPCVISYHQQCNK